MDSNHSQLTMVGGEGQGMGRQEKGEGTGRKSGGTQMGKKTEQTWRKGKGNLEKGGGGGGSNWRSLFPSSDPSGRQLTPVSVA